MEEVAAIAEAGQLVGLGLAVTLFGEDAQVARREREAQPDGSNVAVASQSATRLTVCTCP